MSHVRLPVRLMLGGAVLLGGTMAAPKAVLAQTQAVPVVSQPVVQSVPGGEGMKLNDALSRINKNPRDIPALLDAGKASLDLGDVDAAIGFFQRASTLSPDNPQAKAGLAGAYVLKRDPFTAIPLFIEAEKAGPIDPARLSDRGLAYDLVGDNQTAQRYYRESLAAAPSDETLRRLALSQAIGGDRRGMDATLAPLLQKQDKAAWRTRSFALAILGYGDEAEGIARQSLPADRASAISAYLRFMPRLTPAQQAAAGNLGHFPRAAEVGIDDPRVAQFARPRTALTVAAPAATSSTANAAKSKGKTKPRGADTASATPPKPQAAAPVAPPEPKVGREVNGEPVELAAVTEPAPKPAVQAQLAAVTASSAVQPVVQQPAPKVAVATPQAAAPGFASLDPAKANPAPGFDLKQVPAASTPIVPAAAAPAAAQSQPAALSQPAPVKAEPAPAPSRPVRFEDAFAEFGTPSEEAAPTAGAVDVRKIASPPAASKTAAAKDAGAKDAAAKEVAAKDGKGKPVAKLDECAEVPAKGKAGAKGKTSAKADPKAKASAKSGTKAGNAAATQCKDGKLVKAPSHPSRIWVQIATGKNKKALAFDWNRFVKEDAAVFKSRKGYTSAWGQTNRLLTGPFDSEAAANAYIARLKKAGLGDAFVWTSPAGQVVDALP